MDNLEWGGYGTLWPIYLAVGVAASGYPIVDSMRVQ